MNGIQSNVGSRVAQSTAQPLPPPPREPVFAGMIGQTAPMQQVFEQIRRAAASDATVVICGESGTGKELAATAIHSLGSRSAGPLVDVNAAAIPESLIESELFGHLKGAYTSAQADRKGRFESANGGTLFIDEVGELPLAAQGKLLRVLETRRITPVGGCHDRQVDVRIVAATNRSLESMVASGEFREDLYYRLNVITILLPPLRERRPDIDLLIDAFVSKLAHAQDREPPRLHPELREYLLHHDWPGNVRQLRNCLESMLALSDKPVLTMEDLPPRLFLRKTPDARPQIPDNLTLEELTRQAVEQALARHPHSQAAAARSLGISLRTLQRKLKLWRASHSRRGLAYQGR